MAITIVGTPQAGGAANGADVTNTFDGTLAENDWSLLIGGHGDEGTPGTGGPSTAGYTTLWSVETTNQSIGIWGKFMGATPDTTVVGQNDGSARHGAAYLSFMLRGVDLTTQFDVTEVVVGETADGTDFDTNSITTVTDGSWVFSIGFDGAGNMNVDGGPAGYSGFTTALGDDTIQMRVAAAYFEKATAGAEDPGTFNTSPTSNKYEVTIAIRPAGGAPAPAAVKRNLATLGVGR